MERYDFGGDGLIDYEEFAALAALPKVDIDLLAVKLRDGLAQIQKRGMSLAREFDSFDRDGNGTVSRREFRKALVKMGQTLTDEELRRLMDHLDSNSK